MKKIIILWTVILGSTVAHGQDYLNNSKEEIIKKIQGWVDSTYTVSFSQTVVKINTYYSGNINDTVLRFDTIATLKVSIDGFEKIELEYFFDTLDNDCDSIVIEYYCSKCVDKQIKSFLADKDRKWKLIGADNYISRRQTNKWYGKVGSPQMTIKRTPDNPVCATVYFSIPIMEKSKWKELTKK